jgi:hypothetical protein
LGKEEATEETLTQVGYDPARLLIAWEIFWRRKGWHYEVFIWLS